MTVAVAAWDEIRADMARMRVSTGAVASQLGISYSRFSTLLNSEAETQPTPAFAARVYEAIQRAAEAKAREE